MLVRELMTQPVVAIRAYATIKDAVRRLERHHITSMPVLGDGRRLVGIVSEADLLRDAVVDDPRARQADRAMARRHAGGSRRCHDA